MADFVAIPPYIDSLSREAFSYLKEIDYWTSKFNQIAADLRAAGYHQAGHIGGWNPEGDDSFNHVAFVECGSVGNTHFTSEEFLARIATGPERRSSYYDREKTATQKAVTTTSSARSRKVLFMGTACNWTCIYCLSQGTSTHGPDNRQWHIDHLFAKANGGDSMRDNLVLSCATCNISKSTKLASEILSQLKDRLDKPDGI